MTISKRAAAHRWVTVGVWDSAVILSVVLAWLRCDAGQADCYAAAVLWVFDFSWNIYCGTSNFPYLLGSERVFGCSRFVEHLLWNVDVFFISVVYA
jgi:hypothetical protein